MYIDDLPPLKEHKEGIKYEYPGDAIALFSTPRKLMHFFGFMLLMLKDQEINYHNKKLKIMPCILFTSKSRNATEFVAIDHLFFVYVIAEYIDTYGLGNARQFVEDFIEIRDNDSGRQASIFLFHGYFEQILRIAYINNITIKTGAYFLQYGTKSVFKNSRVEIEFTAININLEGLEKVIKQKQIIDALRHYANVSEATQVAFGKSVSEWWEKSAQQQTYFMTRKDIKI